MTMGMRDGQVVVDDLDDEPDELDPDAGEFDEDDDEDEDDLGEDDLEEPDEQDEQDEQDEDPQAQKGKKPTYAELQAEVRRLREGNTRNNRELRTRRHLDQFMKTHGIEDLDAWLLSLGVDKESGQLPGGAVVPSPVATGPLGDPTGAQDNSPGVGGPSEPQETPPAATPEEVARLVRLELAKQQARDHPTQMEQDTPSGEPDSPVVARAKTREIEITLERAGFNGTLQAAMRILDLNSIQVDPNTGDVTGVEAAVQSLREEIPEWFRRRQASPPPPPVRRGAESVDGGNKNPPPPKKPRWEDQVIDRWQQGR